jgi:hypothetical protein
MSYAIRSGIAITSTYALKQCGRLMKTVEGSEKGELATLQLRLDSKIKVSTVRIASTHVSKLLDNLASNRHDRADCGSWQYFT